jgi:uroporphyrinogen-III synthase
LADRLKELGATPVQLPAIEIAAPEDYTAFDAALRDLTRYDWVVLTSVNGVAAVAHRMAQLGIAGAALSSRKLAVIGPSTAEALKASFRQPDLVPHEYVSEALATTLGEVKGKSFLLLRADIARKDLAEELRRKGAKVTEIAVYRIVTDESTRLMESEPRPDYITLTSSASAHATLAKLREAGREDWMRRVPIACIGPITAQTVRDLGFKVAVGAEQYTIPGLVEAIVNHAKGTVHA